MNDVLKDIESMNEVISMPDAGALKPASTEPPATNAPATMQPATSAPMTMAPGTQAPSTQAPATSAPATTAPATEPPAEDLFDRILSENGELKKRLEALERSKETPKTSAPKTSAPSTEPPLPDEDFLGDSDLDELTRDPSAFNKLLNTMRKKIREEVRQEMLSGNETILKSIPNVVKNTQQILNDMEKVRANFYKENPDLEPFQKVVATVFEEEYSKHPDKSYEEVLKDVGPEARKRLELYRKTQQNQQPNNPPPLHSKKGQPRRGNQQQPQTDPLLNEIDSMNKTLNG